MCSNFPLKADSKDPGQTPIAFRRVRGFRQKVLARHLGIDPTILVK